MAEKRIVEYGIGIVHAFSDTTKGEIIPQINRDYAEALVESINAMSSPWCDALLYQRVVKGPWRDDREASREESALEVGVGFSLDRIGPWKPEPG